MKKSIEILHPGMNASIQDSGRIGYAFYAIPRSGVMDQKSYQIIQSTLQTNDNISVIECTLQAPTILFHDTMQVVVSGADMQWRVNDNPLSLNSPTTVNPGDILKGGFAKANFRGYIGFSHQMQVTRHYGSTSSYAYANFGANDGRLLTKGQVLTFAQANTPTSTTAKVNLDIATESFTLHKGPEYYFLDDHSTELLANSAFMILPQSNRMGARLQGPQLTSEKTLKKSVSVLPGFIQLLPSGQLIILLQDGQTTGGYPRVGYLSSTAIAEFNQVPIGKSVRFVLS